MFMLYTAKQLNLKAHSGIEAEQVKAAEHSRSSKETLEYLFSLRSPRLMLALTRNKKVSTELLTRIAVSGCFTGEQSTSKWRPVYNSPEESCRNARKKAIHRLGTNMELESIGMLVQATHMKDENTCSHIVSNQAFQILWGTRKDELFQWYGEKFSTAVEGLPESWILKSLGWSELHEEYTKQLELMKVYNTARRHL